MRKALFTLFHLEFWRCSLTGADLLICAGPAALRLTGDDDESPANSSVQESDCWWREVAGETDSGEEMSEGVQVRSSSLEGSVIVRVGVSLREARSTMPVARDVDGARNELSEGVICMRSFGLWSATRTCKNEDCFSRYNYSKVFEIHL